MILVVAKLKVYRETSQTVASLSLSLQRSICIAKPSVWIAAYAREWLKYSDFTRYLLLLSFDLHHSTSNLLILQNPL